MIRSTDDALYAAFDLITLGVFIVTPDGEVQRHNPSADRLMAVPGSLSIHEGRLQAWSASDTRALRAAIAEVAGQRCYRAVSVHLRDGSMLPLVVHGLGPVAGVFVTNPVEEIASPPEVLMGLYGLTYSEARLASMLAMGRSLEEASHELRASRHTLRSHLRRIFDKTQTSRQGALVHLLLRGPAQFRLSPAAATLG